MNKLNNIQIRMTDQQINTIMKAGKILENETGESESRSKAIRRMAFERAKQVLKEEKGK